MMKVAPYVLLVVLLGLIPVFMTIRWSGYDDITVASVYFPVLLIVIIWTIVATIRRRKPVRAE